MGDLRKAGDFPNRAVVEYATIKVEVNRPGFPRHSPSSGNSAFQILLAIAA